MISNHYEHHLGITNDRLCPFLFRYVENVFSSVYNWHKNTELILFTKGNGRIKYGADDFEIRAGDIIVINSQEMHYIYSQSGVDFYYLIIDEKFCQENGVDISKYVFSKKINDTQVSDIIKNAGKSILCCKQGDTRLNALKSRNAVLSLLIILCEKYTEDIQINSSVHNSSEQYVKSALTYINDNFTYQLDIEQIADYVGITKYHLERLFKKYTGQTPFAYINTLRCKRAKLYILQGMSITDAAFESGFSSLSYFSRTYKKLIGESPSKEKTRSN